MDLPGRAIIALKRVSPVPSGNAIVREHLLSTPVCQALCPENVLLNVNWSRFSPPDPSVAEPWPQDPVQAPPLGHQARVVLPLPIPSHLPPPGVPFPGLPSRGSLSPVVPTPPAELVPLPWRCLCFPIYSSGPTQRRLESFLGVFTGADYWPH